MFGIGFGEILLILIVVLLIYGPNRLPELAQKVGRVMREFRRATNEVRDALSETDPTETKDSDDA